MSDNEQLLRLLQVIRGRGNTFYLISDDYSPVQLSMDIEKLKKNGIIERREDDLWLTTKGQKLFYGLNRAIGNKGLSQYLSPIVWMKEEQMSQDDIYVPIRWTKNKRRK